MASRSLTLALFLVICTVTLVPIGAEPSMPPGLVPKSLSLTPLAIKANAGGIKA